jgi:hypothetical protein
MTFEVNAVTALADENVVINDVTTNGDLPPTAPD